MYDSIIYYCIVTRANEQFGTEHPQWLLWIILTHYYYWFYISNGIFNCTRVGDCAPV